MIRKRCAYIHGNWWVPLVIILSLFPGRDTRGAEGPLVATLSSQQSAYSLQLIESFEKHLSALFPGCEFVHYSLGKTPSHSSKIFQDIDERKPSLLLTVGSQATDTGLNSVAGVPLVATMILNAEQLAQSPRATGVQLNHSPDVHLQWVSRFLPNVRRVTILYNPKENSDEVEKFKNAAAAFQLELEPIPVGSIKELPAALKFIGRTSEVLLSIPDKTVYSGKTARAVLLSTFRNRIPFVGLSPSWVKAGALYSLDWDYGDLGRQCAEMGGKILNGTAVADIAPATPEKVRHVLNVKTADHMRLKIDSPLVQGAAKVYR